MLPFPQSISERGREVLIRTQILESTEKANRTKIRALNANTYRHGEETGQGIGVVRSSLLRLLQLASNRARFLSGLRNPAVHKLFF